MAVARLCLLLLGLTILGCGGSDGPGAAISKSSYDPDSAAQKMLTEYDTNSDGFITGAELDQCASLKAAMNRFDADKDKKISKDELKTRFTAYSQAAFGTLGISCRVTLGGNAVTGAEVTFTPEKCFGDSVQAGKGKTGQDGHASINRNDGAPGLSPGLYLVTITGPGVPADYSTKALLGHEVGVGGRGEDSPEFKLQSKPK